MMSMQMLEAENQSKAESKPAAASPVEKVNMRTKSFAASGLPGKQ